MNKDNTLNELIARGILPEGKLPAIVEDMRERVIAKRGKSEWEQKLLTRKPMPEDEKSSKAKTEEVAIKINHVSKIYDTKLKRTGVRRKEKRKYYALDDVNFTVYKGEALGLLGTNGSGKSTLLRLVTKISECTKGDITINGQPWLIPSHINLKNDVTGEENIEYRCALMGLKRSEIEKVKEKVIEYSELGSKLYREAKGYSSGERSRLGFSITLAMAPDIYIIDEALSVGDVAFKNKCFNTMKEVCESDAKTVLFVSHNLNEVRKFCTRVVWIENGVLIEDGDVDVVTAHYELFTHYKDELSKEQQKEYVLEIQKRRELTIDEWRKKENRNNI